VVLRKEVESFIIQEGGKGLQKEELVRDRCAYREKRPAFLLPQRDFGKTSVVKRSFQRQWPQLIELEIDGCK